MKAKPFYHIDKLIGSIKDSWSDSDQALLLFQENVPLLIEKLDSIDKLIKTVIESQLNKFYANISTFSIILKYKKKLKGSIIEECKVNELKKQPSLKK